MLGIVFTLMLGAAVFAVLWPLGRARMLARGGSDAEVYRSQLSELERDRAAHLINDEEEASARVEISRRLLAAADATDAAGTSDDAVSARWRRRITALAALVLLPAAASALYFSLGSPTLPGQPLAARENVKPDQALASLIARVETHLAQNPDDGRGWEVLEPVYMRIGRFDDAVRAQTNVLKLLGESAARQSDLGEALVAQANGIVTADARVAFDRARALDAHDPRAQFYGGLAAEQDGRAEEAAKFWRDLIAGAPADAPWLPTVKEALARVEPGAAQNAPGPSAEDIAAASELPAPDRERMVRAMVQRLSDRLHADGSDVDGWLRLMRAYMVLGEHEQARSAANDARQALRDAPEKLRRIEEGARSFGVGG
jgi:cytochrome c-type biogenesis protein CcmH